MLQQEKKNRALLAAFLIGLLTLAGGDVFATANISTMDQLAACIADANEAECELSDSFSFDRQLTITRDVTIRGNNKTLSRADGYAGGLFIIAADSTVTISGLTIDGGAPGWTRDLSENGVVFRFNGTGDRAYGQYHVELGENDITSTASLISNAGTLKIDGSTVQNNYVTTGVASFIQSTGAVEISNSTIQHTGGKSIGSIFMQESAPITVANSTFYDNNSGSDAASSYGAAIHSNFGDVTVKDSAFKHNSTTGNGGGINSYSGDLLVDNCVFENNVIGNDGTAIKLGRGISNSSTPIEEKSATITNSTFSGNISLAKYWNDGDLSPNGVVAHGNGEGTIVYYNDGYDEIIVTNSTFKNEASDWGIVSLYTCTDAEREARGTELCPLPIYSLENLSFEDTKASSPIYLEYATSATIKDVDIKNYDGRGMIVLDIETVDVENMTIDNSAYSGEDRSMIGIFGRQIGTFNIKNLDYQNNVGPVYIDESNEINISDSYFGNNEREAPLRLLPGGAPTTTINIDNVVVENNTAYVTAGSGIVIDNVIDGDMTVNINNSTIRNNTATGSLDSTYQGRGGGISIRSDSATNVNISDDTLIYGNKANNGGDDIFINSRKDESVVTINLPVYFTEDGSGNITDRTVVVRGIGTLGLKSHKIPNPPTNDNVATYVVALASAVLVAGAVISRAGRARI